MLRRVMPQAHLAVSRAVLPAFCAHDRFATTVLDAFVGPRSAGYQNR